MRGLIIIPAFNEQGTIKETLKQFKNKPKEWDLLVVDDGSKDKTAKEARESGVRVVSLPMNLGIGTAVQTGYLIACREDYDWALQFDADGQHLATEIPKLLNKLNAKACVVGSRYLEAYFKANFFRRLGASYFSWVLKILGCQQVTDPSSGFRLCDRRAIALFSHNYPLDYPEVEARLMLHRRQLAVEEVPVIMEPRQGGESSIGRWDAAFYFLKVTLSLVLGRGK